MLGLTAILVLIGACAAVDFQDSERIPDPYSQPYYQSHAAFAQVRLYLQKNVPVENGNFNETDVQRHRVAGFLVAVTDALVESYKNSNPKNPYDPLKVEQVFPRAWSEYNTLAARPLNKLLSEASAKISPITVLIDSLCITKTVEDCNRAIETRVINSSPYLKRRARLLLRLGEVSEKFLNKRRNVERIVRETLSVFNEVRSADFTNFVRLLSKVKDEILARNFPGVN